MTIQHGNNYKYNLKIVSLWKLLLDCFGQSKQMYLKSKTSLSQEKKTSAPGTNVEDIFRLSQACSTDLLQQPLNLCRIHLVAYQQAVCAWSEPRIAA